jgi:hypothetical protein
VQHDDIYIFSNICHDADTYSFYLGNLYSGTGEFTVFNNTIAENGKTAPASSNTGMRGDNPYASSVMKNNIFYKNMPGETTYRQAYIDNDSDESIWSFDYNRYYWPSQTSVVYWGSNGDTTIANLASMGAPYGNQEVNGADGDPGLTDIDNNDYTIASAESAVVDGGVDMGSGNIASLTIAGVTVDVPWDFALGPETDWSGTTPVIDELYRDTAGWDQGAYGWVEGTGEATGAINFNSSGTGKFNYNSSGTGKTSR